MTLAAGAQPARPIGSPRRQVQDDGRRRHRHSSSPHDPRLRMASTLRLYWDSIRLAVDDDDAELETTRLEPVSAELWLRGFSARVEHESPSYRSASSGIASPTAHAGTRTRVCTRSSARRFPCSRRSTIASSSWARVRHSPWRFDARSLPPVPEGFTRDYLVYLDGWGQGPRPQHARGSLRRAASLPRHERLPLRPGRVLPGHALPPRVAPGLEHPPSAALAPERTCRSVQQPHAIGQAALRQ